MFTRARNDPVSVVTRSVFAATRSVSAVTRSVSVVTRSVSVATRSVSVATRSVSVATRSVSAVTRSVSVGAMTVYRCKPLSLQPKSFRVRPLASAIRYTKKEKQQRDELSGTMLTKSHKLKGAGSFLPNLTPATLP